MIRNKVLIQLLLLYFFIAQFTNKQSEAAKKVTLPRFHFKWPLLFFAWIFAVAIVLI